MTRKDYEMIAQAVRDALPDLSEREPGAPLADDTHAALSHLRTAADYIADGCKADNPRFNRKRFIAACGFNA